MPPGTFETGVPGLCFPKARGHLGEQGFRERERSPDPIHKSLGQSPPLGPEGECRLGKGAGMWVQPQPNGLEFWCRGELRLKRKKKKKSLIFTETGYFLNI